MIQKNFFCLLLIVIYINSKQISPYVHLYLSDINIINQYYKIAVYQVQKQFYCLFSSYVDKVTCKLCKSNLSDESLLVYYLQCVVKVQPKIG